MALATVQQHLQVHKLKTTAAAVEAVALLHHTTVQHLAPAAAVALAHAVCAAIEVVLAEHVVTQVTHTKQDQADKAAQAAHAVTQANHGQTGEATAITAVVNLAAVAAVAAHVMAEAGAVLALYESYGVQTDAGLAITHITYNRMI